MDVNLDHPILKDKRVRQALLLAIDRGKLSEQLFKGKQPVAHSNVNPLDWVTNPDTPKYGFDPERAKTARESRRCVVELAVGDGARLVAVGPPDGELGREDGDRGVHQAADAVLRIALVLRPLPRDVGRGDGGAGPCKMHLEDVGGGVGGLEEMRAGQRPRLGGLGLRLVQLRAQQDIVEPHQHRTGFHMVAHLPGHGGDAPLLLAQHTHAAPRDERAGRGLQHGTAGLCHRHSLDAMRAACRFALLRLGRVALATTGGQQRHQQYGK